MTMWFLSRPLEGPLAAHIAGFAKWARDQGYAWYSRYRQVLLAACFSRWLGQQAVSVRRVSSEHLARYLRSRARHVQIHRGDAAALRQFIDFLRRQGVVPAEKIPPRRLTPVEQAVHAFERYLRNERDAGGSDRRQLRAVRPPVPHRSVRRRTGEAVTPVCRRCRAICSAPGSAPAFEARQTPDDRAAIVPALRTLSWGHHAGFGRRCSHRRQLVDDVDPPRDSGGCRAPAVGLHQSAYRDGPPRLRDSAVACSTGITSERSGASRTRGH